MKLLFSHNPFHPHDKDKNGEYPWIYGRAETADNYEGITKRNETTYYLRGKLDSSRDDLKEILAREESAKLT